MKKKQLVQVSDIMFDRKGVNTDLTVVKKSEHIVL